MVLLRILGIIDLIGAVLFLSILFSISPYFQVIIFISGLLILKSLFIFTGDILSLIDAFAGIILLMSIFFSPWTFLLWICALSLTSKSIVSFL